MAKKKSLLKASMSVALVTSAVVVPVAASAAEQEAPLSFSKVVVKAANGTQYVLDTELYSTLFLDKEPASTYDLVKDAQGNLDIVAIQFGDKYITFEQYGVLFLDSNEGGENRITLSEITAAEPTPLENTKEFVNGEWKDVDETPEENLNETFFYNFAA